MTTKHPNRKPKSWTMAANTMILLITAIGVSCTAHGVVSRAERAAAVELVRTLPTDGDSFTEEATTIAVTHLDAILAIDERDLSDGDPLPIVLIVASVCRRQGHQSFAESRFSTIRHPLLKLYIGASLFEMGARNAHLQQFLRDQLAMDSSVTALRDLIGDEFDAFRTQVMAEPVDKVIR